MNFRQHAAHAPAAVALDDRDVGRHDLTVPFERAALRAGGGDMNDGVFADANYVREERDIYRRPVVAAKIDRGLG